MKNIIFITALFLLAGCASDKTPVAKTEIGITTPYLLMPDILNGKVKRLVEKNFIAAEKDGKFIAGRPLTKGDRDSINWTNDFVVTYDENGVPLQCDEIDENGKELISYKVRMEGGKITRIDYSRNGTAVDYSKPIYNEKAYKKFEVRTLDDSLRTTWEMWTDDKGSMDSMVSVNAKTLAKSRYIFTHNDLNRQASFKFINKEGKVTQQMQFVYNKQGFTENQIITGMNGEEMTVSYSYKYDKKGNWIEAVGNDGKHRIIETRQIEYYQ